MLLKNNRHKKQQQTNACLCTYLTESNGPRQYGKDFKKLPNPRLVSRTIHTGKSEPSNHTLLVMQIGQLLDHDLSVIGVPTEKDKTIKCCGVPLDKRFQ